MKGTITEILTPVFGEHTTEFLLGTQLGWESQGTSMVRWLMRRVTSEHELLYLLDALGVSIIMRQLPLHFRSCFCLISAFFWFVAACYPIAHLFYFHQFCIPLFRCVSFNRYIAVFCFLIQCINLCPFTGVFSLLTFNESSGKFSAKNADNEVSDTDFRTDLVLCLRFLQILHLLMCIFYKMAKLLLKWLDNNNPILTNLVQILSNLYKGKDVVSIYWTGVTIKT